MISKLLSESCCCVCRHLLEHYTHPECSSCHSECNTRSRQVAVFIQDYFNACMKKLVYEGLSWWSSFLIFPDKFMSRNLLSCAADLCVNKSDSVIKYNLALYQQLLSVHARTIFGNNVCSFKCLHLSCCISSGKGSPRHLKKISVCRSSFLYITAATVVQR